MLPKKKRVTKELFHIIMKNGKVISGSVFLFRYITQNNPQYAFVAPKSVAKNAVTRNFLRKQGYSAIRSFKVISGAGIFFYKKELKKANFSEIKEDIRKILQKAHII